MDSYLTVNLLWGLICLLGLTMSLSFNAVELLVIGQCLSLLLSTLYRCFSRIALCIWIFCSFCSFYFCCYWRGSRILTGAISTKKAGGSKRGMWFSIIGSVVGTLAGIFIGIPIPIIGSLIAALLFGAGALLVLWRTSRG